MDESPIRCLFIGNSYTARNQLPRLIANLAADTQPPRRLVTEMIVAGGASLRRHWNAGVAIQSVATGTWHYVVLQEQSTLPVKSPLRYHENVRLFAAQVASCGGATVLYETWARQHAPDAQRQISAAVEAIASEVGARIVPVGSAWQSALEAEPGLVLHEKDGSHPTPIGTYLAACTFVATLFDQRPGVASVSERLGIPPGVAARLHEHAWVASRSSATTARVANPRAQR